MTVRGPGPATIRYKINGGAEQTEANVALPWEKQYPVSFVTQQRPTCSFAYYG